VKIDCQTEARSRAAASELPMMSRNSVSKARWICRKQANVWPGSWPDEKRLPSIWKKRRQSARKLE
jgi:hypothetical protein